MDCVTPPLALRSLLPALARWSRALGTAAFLAAFVATATGCGAIAAAASPKVAWALGNPAPMSVVVRRADAAQKTAEQVDRVMTDTPTDVDSPWLAKVAPDNDDATAKLAELRKHPLYAGAGAGSRIVAAEVWAISLAQIEPKGGAVIAPAPAAAPPVEAPAAPVAKAATASTKSAKKSGKRTGDKDKKSSKGPAPADKPAAAERADAAPPAERTDPPPTATTNAAAKYPSLLTALDKDLGAAWTAIIEQKKASGELKTRIAALEAANDAKGTGGAEKKANKQTIDDLEKQVTKIDGDASKLAEAFIPKAKLAASKAAPEIRDRLGVALVNLRQAVDDAKISNGAAALRYPLATPTLIDSAKAMAAVYVGDVIEEKTGKRPSVAGLQPGVAIEDGKVAVTLNGLSSTDMGKLSVSDVTAEVVARTSKWVGRALGLLGTISATKDTLSFEDDVLAALVDGFKSAGWTAPVAATIPEAPGATGNATGNAGGGARRPTPQS